MGVNGYIGDLRCLPFGPAREMRGVWTIGMERSTFREGVRPPATFGPRDAWLDPLVQPKLPPARRVEFARHFLVRFVGRASACKSEFGYGHLGMAKREIVVTRWLTIREVPAGR